MSLLFMCPPPPLFGTEEDLKNAGLGGSDMPDEVEVEETDAEEGDDAAAAEEENGRGYVKLFLMVGRGGHCDRPSVRRAGVEDLEASVPVEEFDEEAEE